MVQIWVKRRLNEMPLLSHTQDPRLSRTILEPVSYLVLLSLAHVLSALLCSEWETGTWLPPAWSSSGGTPTQNRAPFPSALLCSPPRKVLAAPVTWQDGGV